MESKEIFGMILIIVNFSFNIFMLFIDDYE